MFAYWLLFGLFAVASLTEQTKRPGDHRAGGTLIVLGILMILMIGLRFQVGADYESYLELFERTMDRSFEEAIAKGDPGYQALNWAVGRLGGEMWQVNLACGAIFGWGLIRLCQTEPSPLIAALVAIPYLVIVVAMGYTRQAVAIGFIMAGIASLARGGSIARFVLYVAGAALFHRTAVIVLPLAIFAGRQNYFVNALAVIVAAYGLYAALLEDSINDLVAGYIETRYASQGAAIRVVMNVVPSMLVVVAGRRLWLQDQQLRFWRIIAVVSLACIPALFLIPSSTAVDRVALYLLPIQIVAIGRSMFLFRSQQAARLWIIAYCLSVLFVWLNFASHAFAWIPYRTVLEW